MWFKTIIYVLRKCNQSSIVMNVAVPQIYWKQSIKMKNFLYSYHKIVRLFLWTFFYRFFPAASRRTPAGITMDLFEQHQGTHILQVRNNHLFSTFWTLHRPFYFYIINNNNKNKSQFMLFAEFIIFHHYFLLLETVTWWICIGIGVWRPLFVYIRNSFHLFGTFTGKQNHSSSVACISMCSGGAILRGHKNVFMCFLHILHSYVFWMIKLAKIISRN